MSPAGSGEGADVGELRRRAAELRPVVERGLATVRQRIEGAGGDPDGVRVVAVTKTFGAEAVLAALEAGLTDVGENYADELVAKAALVRTAGGTPAWHFVGGIQRNKIGRLAPVVSCWQSLSRQAEADSLARHDEARASEVFVEVNLAGDPGRPGCSLDEVPALAAAVRRAGLDLRGLMAVAPLGAPEDAEAGFRAVAAAAGRLGLGELSLGMSGDLEPAVRAGTTMVRVGTALFGARHRRAGR